MAGDPLRTRLCDEYGCEVPIVGLSTERQVAAAISLAGGIGVFAPLAAHEASRIGEDVGWLAEQVGERPYGVDLVIPASYVEGSVADLEAQIPEAHRDFVERLRREHGIPEPKAGAEAIWGEGQANLVARTGERVDAVLDHRPPIFVSGLGSPAFLLERAHAQGTKVWALTGSTRQARRVLEAGVDLVVATGHDAGAHSGRTGTFSLVPEVVEAAGEVPVLAAGGVTTGRQLLAALSLGAVGVWAGTVWQATEESQVDPILKQQLVESGSERVVKSRARTGKPFHLLRNRWIEAWEAADAPEPLDMPLQQLLVGRVQQAIDDWRVAEFMSVPAGQGVGGIHAVRTVRGVVDDLAAEARAVYEVLGERR